MSQAAPVGATASALQRYRAVRQCSEALAAPLSAEDQQVQSMPDVSPTKWHLAHVTWFFETFLLNERLPDYRPYDAAFAYLFNSYYEAVGPRHARPSRGLLTRPSLDEVLDYRRHVDEAMARLIGAPDDSLAPLVALGLNHEQQHQELLLMDIKHIFSCNPLSPAYRPVPAAPLGKAVPLRWIEVAGGIHAIGHDGDGFTFDNEGPRHEVMLRDFRIASRLVTNGEYLEFIADGGYARPAFWFMDGIETARRDGWMAPLYWRRLDDPGRRSTGRRSNWRGAFPSRRASNRITPTPSGRFRSASSKPIASGSSTVDASAGSPVSTASRIARSPPR
jgi:ergothioneine biosynthesis protein EgtB